jgi:phosphopantothenoylcysteine decarboxylase / phosphopantothenate---cysteine ligase
MKRAKKLRLLVTAGPTREFIDPIRYVSNRSSGKMGYALARAARKLSPRVVLVSGPTALKPPAGVEFVPVVTAAEMAEAVLARYARSDVVIMAAAVCDFKPATPAAGKIKKETFGGLLKLVPTIDILAELGRRKRAQVLVGFAAETDNLERNAREKLARKRLDLIIGNDASAFESDRNAVVLIGRDGQMERIPQQPKAKIAAIILERVRRLVP